MPWAGGAPNGGVPTPNGEAGLANPCGLGSAPLDPTEHVTGWQSGPPVGWTVQVPVDGLFDASNRTEQAGADPTQPGPLPDVPPDGPLVRVGPLDVPEDGTLVIKVGPLGVPENGAPLTKVGPLDVPEDGAPVTTA